MTVSRKTSKSINDAVDTSIKLMTEVHEWSAKCTQNPNDAYLVPAGRLLMGKLKSHIDQLEALNTNTSASDRIAKTMLRRNAEMLRQASTRLNKQIKHLESAKQTIIASDELTAQAELNLFKHKLKSETDRCKKKTKHANDEIK